MRSHALLAAAIGASAAFAGATALVAVSEPAAMDAVTLYAGARLVATGHGGDLVDTGAVLSAERAAAPERERLLPFVQPPAVALVLAPFGLVPYRAAYPLMVALEALALLVATVLLVPRGPRRVPLLIAALVVAPPSAVALAEAQTSPLVLLLVALALRASPRAGGLALGATLLRPQVAPLLIFVGLLDPARRAATVIGALAVVAASTAVVGIDGIVAYSRALVGAAAWSVTGEHGLRASIGWAGPAVAIGAGEVGLALAAVSLAAGAVVVVRVPPEARIRTASVWSLLAGPHVLLHDAVLAYPGVAALAASAPSWPLLAALGWILHAAVWPLGVIVSGAVALGLARTR